MEGKWSLEELRTIIQTAYDIHLYANSLTGGNGLDWMQEYLGKTYIAHAEDGPSYVSRGRDSALPALISGTGANTVYLKNDWLKQDGGARWLAHEMGHIWDMNTGLLTPFGIYGGVADQLNKYMGGNIMSNPFTCRYCDKSGAGNNSPFIGNQGLAYGNNSSADYFAEAFALSVYPDSNNPVPGVAQDWMEWQIRFETMDLFFPIGYQYSIWK